MPRLLWLMFQVPISSPQITRMFGRCPAGAAGRCWACATCIDAPDPSADAAASVVPASRMLRRLILGSVSVQFRGWSTMLLILSVMGRLLLKDVGTALAAHSVGA